MNIHTKLVSVLVNEDLRREKREKHVNPYRIALFLEALNDAESREDLAQGIRDRFERGYLRKKLLKAAGIAPGEND